MKKLNKREKLIQNINTLVDKERKFNDHINELDNYIEKTNNLIQNRNEKLKSIEYYSHPEREYYAQSAKITNIIIYIFAGILSIILYSLSLYYDISGGFWEMILLLSIFPISLGTINIITNVIFNNQLYDYNDELKNILIIIMVIFWTIYFVFAIVLDFSNISFWNCFGNIIACGIICGITGVISYIVLCLVLFFVNHMPCILLSNLRKKSPVYKKIKANYDRIIKNIKKEILETDEEIKKCSNIIEKNRIYLNNFKKEIEKQYDALYIPNTYRNYWIVLKFKNYLKNQLAENLKECYKKFDLEQKEMENRKILESKISEQNKKFEILESKTDTAIKYAKDAAYSASHAASIASDAKSAKWLSMFK